ncbi:MAG: aldo/keto reductase [Phycisphaeraceae bacterium]|nr:aldo/keto reductase [Phycisphaeraceae bacterium]
MALSRANSTLKMVARPLGKTGITLSIVGLGTVKFGRTTGLKYPGRAMLPSDAEASALLDAAEQVGICVLDTAPAYGVSEERLGRFLKHRKHPWFVVTKAGEHWTGSVSVFDFSENSIAQSIDRSLERLSLPQLGSVLLHSDGVAETSKDGFDGAIRALRRAKEAGKVRTIGASLKSAAGVARAIEWADVLMLEIGDEAAMRDAVNSAAGRGVGILVKKALASGHLDKLGTDPIRSAMTRNLAFPGVCSVIVGTTNAEHLRENCEAAARAADELAMNKPDTERPA